MRILALSFTFCFLFGCKKADIVYQKPFGQWAFVGYLQANQIDLANPSKPSFKMNLDLTETPLPLGQTTKYVFVGKGELNEFGGEYEIVPTNDKQGSFKSSNFYATNEHLREIASPIGMKNFEWNRLNCGDFFSYNV